MQSRAAFRTVDGADLLVAACGGVDHRAEDEDEDHLDPSDPRMPLARLACNAGILGTLTIVL